METVFRIINDVFFYYRMEGDKIITLNLKEPLHTFVFNLKKKYNYTYKQNYRNMFNFKYFSLPNFDLGLREIYETKSHVFFIL